MKKTLNRKFAKKKFRAGSALILAVVLTTLLAIIGVTFVMSARVDKMATEGISENKELGYAVESVVTKISQLLAADVPGPNNPGQEYYDYPDSYNRWLASLEPYYVNFGDYNWPQISDIYGQLGNFGAGNWLESDGFNDSVDSVDLRTQIIQPDSPVGGIEEVGTGVLRNFGGPADADGDGVADSRWVELPDVNSSKGKPIYAAIRIVDNCGMININTAYKSELTSDGSVHTDIDLRNVSKEVGSSSAAVDFLHAIRVGTEDPCDLPGFQNDCIWEIEMPNGNYLPFDISDELELRNRFFMDSPSLTRSELHWTKTFLPGYPTQKKIPYDDPSELSAWFTKASEGSSGSYTRRHICTTYNMDRIIDPNGDKMININTASAELIRDALLEGIDSVVVDVNALAAQFAANIVDFRDNDANVTACDDIYGTTYYGFEAQPFISEIGIKIDAVNPDVNTHFAVELYNPFDVSIPLNGFKLSISNGTDIDLTGNTIGPGGFFVIADDADITVFNLTPDLVDGSLKLSDNYVDIEPDTIFETWDYYNITLKRNIGVDLILDEQATENLWFAQGEEKYIQRDDNNWHVVYYNDVNENLGSTLGAINLYSSSTASNYNIEPANMDFVTVGDVLLPLTIGPGTDANTIGQQLIAASLESDVRIDVTDPNFQGIFQYLTVFDPNYHGQDANETRIKGRINVNTAPWFVMAQLPWMTEDIAQTIVDFRSTDGGFKNIGELNNAVDLNELFSIDRYGRESGDLDTLPDITPSDGADNDFEERDVIFSRISNLVTVRSDVFTAYILVRIGADGPQKRVIAIFDRSEVFSPADKPRLIALHPVPDPR